MKETDGKILVEHRPDVRVGTALEPGLRSLENLLVARAPQGVGSLRPQNFEVRRIGSVRRFLGAARFADEPQKVSHRQPRNGAECAPGPKPSAVLSHVDVVLLNPFEAVIANARKRRQGPFQKKL